MFSPLLSSLLSWPTVSTKRRKTTFVPLRVSKWNLRGLGWSQPIRSSGPRLEIRWPCLLCLHRNSQAASSYLLFSVELPPFSLDYVFVLEFCSVTTVLLTSCFSMGPGIPGAVVPQLSVPSDGDVKCHHPSLCALHQAQRWKAPLRVSPDWGPGWPGLSCNDLTNIL